MVFVSLPILHLPHPTAPYWFCILGKLLFFFQKKKATISVMSEAHCGEKTGVSLIPRDIHLLQLI
jgi:hypothetical protein